VPNTKCSVCGLNFSSTKYLAAHFKQQHGDRDLNERPHKCSQCASAFTTLSNMRMHVRRVHDGYKGAHMCVTCRTAFVKPSELITHMRTHTGERPYKCTECDMDFAHIGTFRTHTRSQHTRERPYKCEHCTAVFIDALHLRRHTRTAHPTERTHACTVCNKRFSRSSNLRTHHMIVHKLRYGRCLLFIQPTFLLPTFSPAAVVGCVRARSSRFIQIG
jgi:KRAB domain-containing zinc finger protein